MNKKQRLFLLLSLLCIAAFLPAGGKKEKITLVQVTGTVRLVGSSPLSEIVISAENGHWYIAQEDTSKLMELQQRRVTVEGAETVEQLTLANGLPAGERRTLKNIKIITVQ